MTEAGAVLDDTFADGDALVVGDKRFPIRVVEWNDATHKAAMIAANSQYIAGEFVATDLEDLVLELKDSDLAELVSPLRLDEFVHAFNDGDLVDSFAQALTEGTGLVGIKFVFSAEDAEVVKAKLQAIGGAELSAHIVKMCHA